MKKSQAAAAAVLSLVSLFIQTMTVCAFAPSLNVGVQILRNSRVKSVKKSSFSNSSYLRINHRKLEMMMDPTTLVEAGANFMSSMNAVASSSSFLSEISSHSIAFSDQGQNLAGFFFQASLLPYVVFLYFLNFHGNRVPVLANFGFQFLLLFVFSTIPSGIISKSNYGCSLADVDWLHGGAESLLTITNLLIVLGFTNASTQSEPLSPNKPRLIALGALAAFIAAMSLGPSLGFEAHSPFLFGLGNLPTDWTSSLPWVSFICYFTDIFIIC